MLRRLLFGRSVHGVPVGLVLGIALLSGLFAAQGARAATLTFALDFEFSGADEPAGTSPWVTATFDDSFGGPNTVRLTMQANNLVDSEFIDDFLFNFDPALDPTFLSFNAVNDSASSPSVSAIANDFQADGDGKFDIQFDFPPPPGNIASKFTAGEQVIFDITFNAAIDVNSFNFQSVESGGQGTFNSAAHIQGIAPGGSGWIGQVPEPASGLLVGMGLLALGVRQRRAIS